MADLEEHTFTGSSRVQSATYNPRTREVIVTFPDGVQWEYRQVSRAEWYDFTNAASAGRYLAVHLEGHPNGPA